MEYSKDVMRTFFQDLKKFNSSNFRTIVNADLSNPDPTIHKAFSSVVTRYFIFCEKHPELTPLDLRILFFRLKIDLISRYFAEYPEVDPTQLIAFQVELKNYIKDSKEGEYSDGSYSSAS